MADIGRNMQFLFCYKYHNFSHIIVVFLTEICPFLYFKHTKGMTHLRMLLQDNQKVNTYKMDMLKLGKCYYFIITYKTQCQLLQPQFLQQKCLLVAGVCEKISSHIQSDSLKCHKKTVNIHKIFLVFQSTVELSNDISLCDTQR